MKDYLNELTEQEREVLILAPVYAALMGALKDGNISRGEEKDAVNLAHFRTVTSAPILRDYYLQVEKSFEQNMRLVEERLPDNLEESKNLIQLELLRMEAISKKLDLEFAQELSSSLRSFSEHVAKEKDVSQGWLRYFLFPANFEDELGKAKSKS